MLTSFITLGFALWISYCFYKNKERGLFLLALLLYAEILTGWPLYWSYLVPFGIISLALAGVLFYEAYDRKERSFFTYGLVALGCGLILFMQVMQMNHPILKDFISMVVK
ncbi:MAG TPA: hypothetical protein VLG76_06380 [Rhabdochlamydiaceae bacterium]|nr:hypothetical protein [Rhabdochlamydiaceae bacterium]